MLAARNDNKDKSSPGFLFLIVIFGIIPYNEAMTKNGRYKFETKK